jgi:hypothetical protein
MNKTVNLTLKLHVNTNFVQGNGRGQIYEKYFLKFLLEFIM